MPAYWVGGALEQPEIEVIRLQAAHPKRRKARRELSVVVIRVHTEGQPQLLQIIDADNPSPGFLRAGDRRQQHRRQNRNDADDHQQFDQSKRALMPTEPRRTRALPKQPKKAMAHFHKGLTSTTYNISPGCRNRPHVQQFNL